MEEQKIFTGLKGVLFAKTNLTYIDGEHGVLLHLGIPISEWENSTFEEMSYALLNGRLPKVEELEEFSQTVRQNRHVPREVLTLIEQIGVTAHPMHVLRTAVSLLGALDSQADQIDTEGRQRIGLRLIAQVATIVAATARVRQGQPIVSPDLELSHAANFLYMLNGQRPTEEEARLFDIALILHLDHGMNASTFTGIATASTLSDMYSSITSAIGALKGPLHGGANEAVLNMLAEIGEVENVESYIDTKLANKEKIMGVGHPVYKFFDPRSRILRKYAQAVVEKQGKSKLFEMLEAIETKVVEKLGSRGIYPNVDFYSGVVYTDLGLTRELLTPVFAVARISGWVASILEYVENNQILRPGALYEGEKDRHYVPIENR